MASYRIGREVQFQYEGLHDLCFMCGKYGHKEVKCLKTYEKESANAEQGGSATATREGITMAETIEQRGTLGPWMVAQKARCRQTRVEKGTSSILMGTAERYAARDNGNSAKL